MKEWNKITVDGCPLRTYTKYFCTTCNREIKSLVSTKVSKVNPNGGWICAECHCKPVFDYSNDVEI